MFGVSPSGFCSVPGLAIIAIVTRWSFVAAATVAMVSPFASLSFTAEELVANRSFSRPGAPTVKCSGFACGAISRWRRMSVSPALSRDSCHSVTAVPATW